MSPLLNGPFNTIEPTLSSTDMTRGLAVNPQSWGAPSQGGRPYKSHAMLPLGFDISTKTMPQPTAHVKLSQQTQEPGRRLPGVRQLLLPHSLVASDPSTPSPQQSPWNFLSPSMTAKPIPRESFPSISKGASEGDVMSLYVDQSDYICRGQATRASSIEAIVAAPSRIPRFMQAPWQRSPQIPSLSEASLSPGYHRHSSAQNYQLDSSSPGSIYTNGSANPGTTDFRGCRSLDASHHPRGPVCLSPWHETATNPDWGTTKAGKPRKRLAQACLNCRYKKIRCHPNVNSMKCTQCERSDTDCRFESGSRLACSVPAPEGDPSQISAVYHSPFDAMNRAQSPASGREKGKVRDEMTRQVEATENQQVVASSIYSGSSKHSIGPLKRQKREINPLHDHSEVLHMAPEPRRSSNALSPTTHPPPAFDMTGTLGLAGANWTVDPHTVTPMAMEYLDLYFAHINQATYCMLPKDPFLKWVRGCREKTLDDKMILYTLMAMGCRFSTHKESIAHGKRLLQIARYAEQNSFGKFTLQLVQTRLMLGLLNFSLGNSGEAWDFCGSAVRAVCGLKYNSEEAVTERPQLDDLEYGLDRSTLAECRRRTFWSAYIMDRYNGFCSGHVSMLQDADCFLRLPCRDVLYENQDIPETPHFATVEQSPTWQNQTILGNMAYLVEISSVWSDVLQNIYRTRHRVATSDQPGAYGHFYARKQHELQAIIDRLPQHLFPCNAQNIEKALQGGYIGTFISLHALYRTTHMKLNRHAVQGDLGQESLGRNLKAAQFHARELLKITQTLARLYHEQQSSEPFWVYSTPFPGYSILSAVDILTSIGSLAELKCDLELVQSSLDVVQELKKYWASAQKQLKMIAIRFEELMKALESASTQDVWFVTTNPMEDTFGRELDLLYSPQVEERFKALGHDMAKTNGIGVLVIESLDSGVKGYGN